MGPVPKMVAVPEAPNRATPAQARRQVKAYKRRERQKRKSSRVRTHEKPQNALIPRGAGCSAFLGAAARNAARLELAEQERLTNNPYVPRAASSANLAGVSSASWASERELAELEARMADGDRSLRHVSHRPSTAEASQLFDEFEAIAEHLTEAERAELRAEMDEVSRLSASFSQGQQDTDTHNQAQQLFAEFETLAEHLPEAEKAELQAEMDEIKRLSVGISSTKQPAAADTEFLSAMTEKYELLADHLDVESREALAAEIAAVTRISQELGKAELPSGWGSLIGTQRTQTALTTSSSARPNARGERRSKHRTLSARLKKLQLESTSHPDRPSSRDSMDTYLIKRPLASPNAVNNDLLRKHGKGSLGVGWDEFKRYERPASVTDLHSIERQLERRRKADLAASWADRTAPEWNGPCSVPPLAMPPRSLIGITRVSETVKDVFKGHTIQEDARTPRTAGWQPAQLSQIEVALRDGPARACTATASPGVPALNSRPVALGAYVDRFWAGPALAGVNKQAEVSTRREELIRAGRKSWSNKNRPPPLEVKKGDGDRPRSPRNEDARTVRFKACTVLVSDIPAEFAERDGLARIFDSTGHFLQGICCALSVKADLADASGAWGLVTFATPEDVQLALRASKEKQLRAGGRHVKVSELTEQTVERQPTGSQVWADAFKAAEIQFDQLETKVLDFAGVLLELVQATGLPSMDLCGLSDPYAVITVRNAKTPEATVCDVRTSAVCKSTKEPEWNQDFVLPIPPEDVPDAQLIVDLYDQGVGDDDDFIGRVRLNLSDMEAKWTDQWYELAIEDSSYAKIAEPDEDLTQALPPLGLLRLRIRWVPSINAKSSGLTLQEDAKLQRACLEMVQKGLDANKQPIGKLTVHIIRGQGLPNMDIFGTCDPFVTLEHAGKKVKTPVVKQSLTPVWDSTFHFDVHDMHEDFNVVAFDWDRGHDDDDSADHDEIGRTSFSLHEILGGKRECEEWVPLFQSSAMGMLKTRGNILCKLEFAPAFGATEMFVEPAEGVVDVALLELTVVRAQDVPQMDEIGASDPYCVLSLHGVNSGAGSDQGKSWKSKDFKTKVVTSTLNPAWRQSFKFTIYDPTAMLHIDMYDEDFNGQDDYMCGLRIPVATLLNTEESHWYRLQDEETVNDPDMATAGVVDKPQQRALSCPCGALLLQTSCKIESAPEENSDLLGNVHINIRKLNGLKLRKGRRKPSIFIEMEYGGVKQRTAIQKSTLTPVWNEAFEYPVYTSPGLRSCVTCKIFLYDLLGAHELAGTVTIAMKDAAHRDSDFPVSFPFFVYDDSSSSHKTPKKLGELELSLVWKANDTIPNQETRPQASLRASLQHVLRATRYVLAQTGDRSGTGQFAVAKQADVLSRFGQMKGTQWVVIPALELIKLEGVNNDSLGLSPDTEPRIWAEIEWNGDVVATTEEVARTSQHRLPTMRSENTEKDEALDDSLKKRKETSNPWLLQVHQALPSTKTGSKNTLKIRLYARGIGVLGYRAPSPVASPQPQRSAEVQSESAAELTDADTDCVEPRLNETVRASMDLDAARAALDAERKGHGYESDSSAGGSADLIGVDANESETHLKEIRDHLAFVERISSPTNHSDRASTPNTDGNVQAADPSTQLVQSQLSVVPLPDVGAAGSSMVDMFDPSGLQMSSVEGARILDAANSQQISSLGEEKEDRLREIFARADRNGDGSLTRSELILRLRKDAELALLLQLPQRIGDGERDVFETVFQGMDQDDDRAITSEEFVAYFLSFKSEFERTGTPNSRPSTAATTSELLALTDGGENVDSAKLQVGPTTTIEAEPGPEPEQGGPAAAQKNSNKPSSPASSSGGSRPPSRMWQMLSTAVREPIYGDKTVCVGSVALFATGVRGFPRETLPMNVMRDDETVPEADVWPARRCVGQLSIKVTSQSISDLASNVSSSKAQKQGRKQPNQDCSIRIRVAQARALTPMWRADGAIGQPPDSCSAFVMVRPACIAFHKCTLKHSCHWHTVRSCQRLA